VTRYLEILGQSVPVPDPDSVAILSGQYRSAAAIIGEAKSQLAGIGTAQAQAVWAGQAASAFTRKLGELPGQLEKAWQSYNTVAWALSGYASGLRPVVTALSSLAYQAEEADGTLRATDNARNQVIAQGHDPVATGWNTRLSEAQAEVGLLRRRLSALLAELEGLSAQCVGEIRQAEHEGISNNLISDFRRYIVQDGGAIAADGAKAMHVLAKVADVLFVKPFTDLPGLLKKYIDHPDWQTFGALLADYAAVLAIVAFFIPGADLLTPFLFALNGIAVGSEAVAAATHEKDSSWADVGFGFAGLGFAGAGAVLGKGVAASDGFMQGAFDEGDFGQLKGLANGWDARVSGNALLDDGLKSSFSLEGWAPDSGQADQGVLGTLKDEAYSFMHFGADGNTNSPAAANFQHLEWGLNRGNQGLALGQDWVDQKGRSL
jgi:hypothetical protein